MLALWLHEMGAKVVALPFRIVIGLVFIYQGMLNVNTPENSIGMLVNFNDFGISDNTAVPAALGILLVIAGIMSIVGMLVRSIGIGLFILVMLNLFAGLTLDFESFHTTALVLQNRMLLAVCSLVLFFLGSGMFSLDSLIFRGMSRAVGRGKGRRGAGDDDAKAAKR